MTDRQIIIVSEVAPRLKAFTAEAAREFFRDYFSYRNRVDESEAISPMKVLINPRDLDLLLRMFKSEGWCRLADRRPAKTGKISETRRASLQTPMTPAVLSASFDEEVDSLSVQTEKKAGVKFSLFGSETEAKESKKDEPKGSGLQPGAALKSVASEVIADLEDPLVVLDSSPEGEALPFVVPLSNAHVELMLVQILGPRCLDDACDILRSVKMEKGASPSIEVAYDYVSRFEDAIRWCRHFLPDVETMIKQFCLNIKPKKLADSMKNQKYRTMSQCTTSFIVRYRDFADAKSTVSRYDDGEPHRKDDTKSKPVGKGETHKESKAKPKNPGPKVSSTGEPKTITCFNCGEPGHKKPDCPKLKGAMAAPAPPKRIGALMMGSRAKLGPYVACDVSAPEVVRGAGVPRVRAKGNLEGVRGTSESWVRPDGGAERTIRMQAHFDTGADMNGVGQNLVPHMELHGGVVTKLPVPETVIWSDRGVTREIVSQIKMHFEITGCSTGKDLVFLIVPWDTDHLIVGWPTLTQEKWLDRMSDLLTIQRAAVSVLTATTVRPWRTLTAQSSTPTSCCLRSKRHRRLRWTWRR